LISLPNILGISQSFGIDFAVGSRWSVVSVVYFCRLQTTSGDSQPSISKWILNSRIFFFGWILLFAAALITYYFWQIPLRFVARNLAPLALAAVHIFALTGLGYPIIRFAARAPGKSVEFLMCLAFGIGLTGFLSLILGLSGYLNPNLYAIWELIGLVLFLFALRNWRPTSFPRMEGSIWNIMGAAILLLFVVIEIPFVVAPDISTDTIAYHLLIPKLYIAHGGIYHIPLLVEAYYPNLAELNYVPLLLLTNEFVCKALHFCIGICVLTLLGKLTSLAGARKGNLLAPALFLSMPVTAIHIAWAWNDFIFVLFVLLFLTCLIQYHQSDKSSFRELLLAGIFLGLASWTKYTFVLFFLATLLILFFGYKRWNWNVRHYPVFFISFGLLALPWMLQNWMFTGNPFYPFLHHVFPSPYWTDNSSDYFHNALRRWEISDWSWLGYFTFPFYMTIKPRLIDIHPGILPLTLAPLLFLKSSSSGIRLIKVFIACSFLAWLLIHTENRSLFSVFAVIFCVASVSLMELGLKNRRRTLIVMLILATACTNFFYALFTMYQVFDPLRYFYGRETASDYRSRLSESQRLFDYLNRSADAKNVLLVSSHVPYYLDRPAYFSSFADPPIAEVLTYEMPSTDAFEKKLQSLRITHILLNRTAYEIENKEHLYSWSAKQRMLFEEFVLKKCEPVMKQGNDYVFRLKQKR
jgi:dolichyl-phosphate-mannose-protein mannosyltransferase